MSEKEHPNVNAVGLMLDISKIIPNYLRNDGAKLDQKVIMEISLVAAEEISRQVNFEVESIRKG